jgi:phosphate transport system substrate-binding protein
VKFGLNQASVVRILIFLAIGAVLGAFIMWWLPDLLIKKEGPPTYTALQTGGTSNVDIIAENRWRTAYRNEKGVDLKYDSTGSTKGLEKMIAGEYAIAFTHGPMPEDLRKQARDKGGDVVHIPVVLCAVVPVYNVKELNAKAPLKFNGEVLGDIFLGKIDRWNHPAIKNLNSEVADVLPETKIVVVHRSDSSGTTFIFTDYLVGVSPAWKEKLKTAQNVVEWAGVGVGKERNTGVANQVQATEGAIGYVDLLHALGAALKYGSVQNQKGTYVQAAAANMTIAAEALSNTDISDDLTFSLANKSGADAYPICGAIWAVCYQKQSDPKLVSEFLTWVIRDGQKFAATTAYAPLPQEIVRRAEDRLKLIKAGP